MPLQLLEPLYANFCCPGPMTSRRGIVVDVLCALLVIPIWAYYGPIIAVVSALVLGLVLRFVLRASAARPRKPS
jgi:hypothetical protein